MCAFSDLKDIFYNVRRTVRSSLLTLLVYTLYWLKIARGQFFKISSRTHIGTVEIWKVPTFSPGRELICCLPWRMLLERLIVLNRTQAVFDNAGNRQSAFFKTRINPDLCHVSRYTQLHFKRKDVSTGLVSPCFPCCIQWTFLVNYD